MKKGCPFGSHRVLEPAGCLPQPAWKLDHSLEEIYDNEILIRVHTLHIDAASFVQMKEQAGGDPRQVGEIIRRTVVRRGKQHNEVTGSGGMLVGSVARVGESLAGRVDLKPGERVATLVSLSLTPLALDKIIQVNPRTGQVEVEGWAVLFESGVYARLPADLPEKVALAVLDVAGAPARVAGLVRPGDVVLLLGGGGKSGLLCLYEAKKRAGVTGRVFALGRPGAGLERIKALGLADGVIQADARDALDVLAKVEKVTGGRLADITVNLVSTPGTEMASILATRDGGTVYFFSMATSFTAAALGAEGVGRDVQMLIGSGYTRGHVEMALQILRECPPLMALFREIYT